MKDIFNEYLKSSLITFVVGFCISIYPNIDAITTASLHDGVLIGVLLAAVRAGVKAVVELTIATYQAYKN